MSYFFLFVVTILRESNPVKIIKAGKDGNSGTVGEGSIVAQPNNCRSIWSGIMSITEIITNTVCRKNKISP